MKDLSNSAWIKFKGFLFLLLGLLAASILLFQNPNWKTAALLAVAVWAFCRFYYFAFYVIERYVDSEYRFSGLFSFVHYLISKERQAGGN